MPKLAPGSFPKYGLHKQSGQAIVTLNGRDILLGKHNTDASRQKYDRVIAEWIANGRRLPSEESRPLIVEIAAQYLQYARMYYRRHDGSLTEQSNNIARNLKVLDSLYGDTVAETFGPVSLEIVREKMVRMGWVRKSINARIMTIRRMFKWAAARELIPASAYHGLQTLEGLKASRCNAVEGLPVKSVPAPMLDQILGQLTRHIGAMVQVQLLTLDRLAPGASRDRLELAQGSVNDRAGLGAEYEKGKKEITDRYTKLDAELQTELRKTNKPEKMKEIDASIKTLAAGRNDELLALEKQHNAKINALGEEQVRDRAKLEKRIIADAAGAVMERLGGWKDAILKWSDRNTADKTDGEQNKLGVASRLARLKGDNTGAERIDKAAELKRRLAEIDQRAVDEARDNPTDQAGIKARATKAREQATLETGLDLVAMRERNAARSRVDLPSFSGDTHGISGFLGQGVTNANQFKGAIDPMVEAQKEVKKLQEQSNEILRQVATAISGLVNKLQTIPPGEGA